MKRNFLLMALLLSPTLVSHAQVAVKDEPRHKNIFENGVIRVLDVWVHPGDTSLYHRHEIPSVFITFTNSSVGVQAWKQSATIGKSTAGKSWYDPFTIPYIHRVWNMDQTIFHAMDIEILTTDIPNRSQPISNSMLKLMTDANKVRIYNLELLPNAGTELKTVTNPILIVPVTGEITFDDDKGNPVSLKTGSIHWMEKNSQRKLTNNKKSQADCRIFEIKM